MSEPFQTHAVGNQPPPLGARDLFLEDLSLQ